MIDPSCDYLTVKQVLDLPTFRHLKPATLAKWRQSGRGPRFIRVGRKPFYSRTAIDAWLLEQERNTPASQSVVSAVSPPEVSAGSARRSYHRLGGHVTRAERRDQAT